MKKTVLLVVLAIVIVGCGPRANNLTMDQSGMLIGDRYYTAVAMTSRDRFGTELQSQTLFDDTGKMVSAFSGHGLGVGNNAMVGAVAGLEQAGGLIGAGALIRPANYFGGNSSATGGKSSSKSSAKTYQSQNQAQIQAQKQGQAQGQSLRNTNSNINTNLNTNTNHNVNTALGGAGGSGGNVGNITNTNVNTATGGAGGSVNAGVGGIGNIDATGNSVVNTGQGMINTGNNATVTGPLTQN